MPAWLSRTLSSDEPMPVRQVFRDGDETVREREWQQRTYQECAHLLCRRCNNGPLSQLEELTKPVLEPLLHGADVELGRDMQRALAAWAVKTIAMLEHGQGAPWPALMPAAEVSYVVEHGEPSENVLVLLASCLEPKTLMTNLHGTNVEVTHHGGGTSAGVAHIGTLVLGCVVLQVICVAGIPGLPQAFALDERPTFALIWPFVESLIWRDRDRASLNDADLADFEGAIRAALASVAS